MALSFPLSLTSFSDALRIAGITFDLPDAVEQKTLGSGEIITAQNGVRLWQGTVTLSTQTWANHEAAMALIRALQRPGATFLASPIHFDGQNRGLGNGVVEAFTGDLLGVRLNSLPASVTLARGTFFSFVNSGVYHLHQLAEATTADGTGRTGVPEVVPSIRASAVAGGAAEILRPVCKAVMVPRSVDAASIRAKVAGGVTFAWRQTLR